MTEIKAGFKKIELICHGIYNWVVQWSSETEKESSVIIF